MMNDKYSKTGIATCDQGGDLGWTIVIIYAVDFEVSEEGLRQVEREVSGRRSLKDQEYNPMARFLEEEGSNAINMGVSMVMLVAAFLIVL